MAAPLHYDMFEALRADGAGADVVLHTPAATAGVLGVSLRRTSQQVAEAVARDGYLAVLRPSRTWVIVVPAYTTRDRAAEVLVAHIRRLEAEAAKANKPTPHRVNVRRIALTADGYDSTGAYWGSDQPLWYWWSDETGRSGHVRASTRVEAFDLISAEAPGALFYRTPGGWDKPA